MEDSEYKRIEDQALHIVNTLNKLKREIEEYKDAKAETQKGLESLTGLMEAMSEAAQELEAGARAVRESDYIVEHDFLAKQTDELSEACNSLQKNIDNLPTTISKVLDTYREQQNEAFAQLVSTLSDRLEQDASERRNALDQLVESQRATIEKMDGIPALLERHAELLSEQYDQHGNILTTTLDERLTNSVDKNQVILERISQLKRIFSQILEAQKVQNETLTSALKEQAQNILDQTSDLKPIIARIDRNTQKGFGRERG